MSLIKAGTVDRECIRCWFIIPTANVQTFTHISEWEIKKKFWGKNMSVNMIFKYSLKEEHSICFLLKKKYFFSTSNQGSY